MPIQKAKAVIHQHEMQLTIFIRILKYTYLACTAQIENSWTEAPKFSQSKKGVAAHRYIYIRNHRQYTVFTSLLSAPFAEPKFAKILFR